MTLNSSSITTELGQSLSSIAHDQLGDFSQWREIATLNNLDIFQQIPINTELQIPSAEDLTRMAKQQIQQQVGSLTDLSSIAQGRFGGLPGVVNEKIKLIDWLY